MTARMTGEPIGMCFSATANFGASAVIGAVGVATLCHVRHPRGILFAVTPLLFALRQFTEGFVWLGLEGRIDSLALSHVTFLFILYAQGILPLLMPLAVLLMEPPDWRGWHKRAIAACVAVGAVLCGWVVWAVVALPSYAVIEHHSIAYRNPAARTDLVGAFYVVATCGALILSTHRVIRWFGILNLAACRSSWW